MVRLDDNEQPGTEQLAGFIEQVNTVWRDFGDSLARTIAPAVAAINEFVRRLFASIPHHARKRYMPPTPWHYKRARVALRRAGQPVTGDAVTALATAMRRGTP